MKQISSFALIIAFTLLLFASSPIECVASSTTRHSVPLKKEKKENNPELSPIGSRIPARDIIAIISPDEFQSGIDPNDIISYEIWDESDNTCLASFSEDIHFCQYLFNTPDYYLIKIFTADYIYVGFISTIEEN